MTAGPMQMAYLARRGDVDLVVTEDSDLLAYACPRCGPCTALTRAVQLLTWGRSHGM